MVKTEPTFRPLEGEMFTKMIPQYARTALKHRVSFRHEASYDPESYLRVNEYRLVFGMRVTEDMAAELNNDFGYMAAQQEQVARYFNNALYGKLKADLYEVMCKLHDGTTDVREAISFIQEIIDRIEGRD